jgi:hypothetical protein
MLIVLNFGFNLVWSLQETNKTETRDQTEGAHRYSEPPQQPGGECQKICRGPTKLARKNGATDREIPSLSTLCPPYRHYSNQQKWNPNVHQKDAPSGAEGGERGKEGWR